MKMRPELFELLQLKIRITMKMKNYTTQSNFALRTLCLTSGIAASLLFAATQPARRKPRPTVREKPPSATK